MPRGKNQDFFNNLMPKAKFQTFQCLIFYREGLLTIYGETDIALSEQLKNQLNYLIFSAFYGNMEITRAHAFGKIKGISGALLQQKMHFNTHALCTIPNAYLLKRIDLKCQSKSHLEVRSVREGWYQS